VNGWLAVLGVVLVLVLSGAGLFAGEADRIMNDPEVRARREAEERDRERREAWRKRRDEP
jgi:hypothetical protein